MSAFNTLKSTINEATMIANQVQDLANQARNLTSLPSTILSDLTGTIGQYTTVLQEAQGLTYQLQGMQGQFTALYPSLGRGMTAAHYAQKAPQFAQQAYNALQDAMRAQSSLDRLLKARSQLTEAGTASQNAVGILQAQQAGNQISGIMVQQLAGLEEIQAATGRAQASMMANDLMGDAAAKANAAHMMEGWGTRSRNSARTTFPDMHY